MKTKLRAARVAEYHRIARQLATLAVDAEIAAEGMVGGQAPARLAETVAACRDLAADVSKMIAAGVISPGPDEMPLFAAAEVKPGPMPSESIAAPREAGGKDLDEIPDPDASLSGGDPAWGPKPDATRPRHTQEIAETLPPDFPAGTKLFGRNRCNKARTRDVAIGPDSRSPEYRPPVMADAGEAVVDEEARREIERGKPGEAKKPRAVGVEEAAVVGERTEPGHLYALHAFMQGEGRKPWVVGHFIATDPLTPAIPDSILDCVGHPEKLRVRPAESPGTKAWACNGCNKIVGEDAQEAGLDCFKCKHGEHRPVVIGDLGEILPDEDRGPFTYEVFEYQPLGPSSGHIQFHARGYTEAEARAKRDWPTLALRMVKGPDGRPQSSPKKPPMGDLSGPAEWSVTDDARIPPVALASVKAKTKRAASSLAKAAHPGLMKLRVERKEAADAAG